MSDYTPSTDEVRNRYWIVDGGISSPEEKEDFNRWLASVEDAVEQRGAEKERERIARALERKMRNEDGSQLATGRPHHGACYQTAARIAREGA